MNPKDPSSTDPQEQPSQDALEEALEAPILLEEEDEPLDAPMEEPDGDHGPEDENEEAQMRASEDSEQARRQAEALRREEAKLALRRRVSEMIFSDDKISELFMEHLVPLLDGIYDKEGTMTPREFASCAAEVTLILASLAKQFDAPVFPKPDLTTRDVAAIAPYVADHIQEKLNIHRPRGKEAARLAMMQYLKSISDKNVLHFKENDDIMLTAYQIEGGDEEFLILSIDPGVCSPYSFMRDGKVDTNMTPIQSKLPKSQAVFHWDELQSGFYILPAIRLVNGRHPDSTKVERKSEREIQEGTNDARIELVRASDDVFQKITAAAQQSYEEVLRLCQTHGVNVQSVVQVMNANGFMFSEEHRKFVKAPLMNGEDVPAVPPLADGTPVAPAVNNQNYQHPQDLPPQQAPSQSLQNQQSDPLTGLLALING